MKESADIMILWLNTSGETEESQHAEKEAEFHHASCRQAAQRSAVQCSAVLRRAAAVCALCRYTVVVVVCYVVTLLGRYGVMVCYDVAVLLHCCGV